MRSGHIIPLYALSEKDLGLVGHKAASLARLVGAGLPVPPAFCITSSAYRGHIDGKGIAAEIESLKRDAAKLTTKEVKDALEKIRRDIAAAPLSSGLCGELEQAYRELAAGSVAVRSSATAEDLPGTSFAGQYDSFLDVTGLDGLLGTVKRCWASLWTERAFDYRRKNGFEQLGVDMAVIVQEMVPAEAAGVVFTADPVTARADRITIEAVTGLGDSLVSGRAAPDRFIVSRRGLLMLSSSASNPCIGEDTARIICLMAMRAEAVFGCPLDLEWAIAAGRVFLLQARPITALGRERSWEDRQVWSNINAGEVLPDVVTPATWSLVQIIVFQVFGSIFGRIGLDFGDNTIVGQIAGRAYFNLNTMTGAIRSFPGLRRMDVGQALGGAQGGLSGEGSQLQEVSIPDGDVPDLDFSLGKVLARAPAFLAWFHSLSSEKGRDFIAELRTEIADIQDIDISRAGEDEIVARIDRVLRLMAESDAILGVAARGMYYFMTLDRLCGTWLKQYRGISANRLCSGLAGMRSADAGFELWGLALAAHAEPGLRDAVLSGTSFEALEDIFRDDLAAAGFFSGWRRFMLEHGHHSRGELELRNRRWSEDPAFVLDVLRGYLLSMDKVDPLAKLRENEMVREELTSRCRRLLANPIKRLFFDHVLRQAQQGLLMRENVKNEAVKGVAFIRTLLLELGRRMASRDLLDEPEDIFFLYLEEIDGVLRDEDRETVREEIRRRRADYERNLAITPPKLIYGRFDPEDFIPDEIDSGVDELKGLAVCPGVVSGPARVMLRSDVGQVQPGEIMVAPFTDPGWTPHFLTAAGIVMDLGGLLSHGSIVAREYGIPTVVNVGPATRIIKTGQIVQVDGDRGTVRILKDAPRQHL
ncbi:MAG: PEP/pyruvate-binding domain-containing protein [Actinomycetota bacterium]